MVTEQDVERWAEELTAVADRIAPRFKRPEIRSRAAVYLQGLLASVERKNGWQLAEFLGDETPKNLQHFIARATWRADAVRDDLQTYVVEHLGEPDGVLIVDETGFLKKGRMSPGVARMYSGTAGRIENCQIGVFLAYRSSKGQTLIDRELYLPKEWAEDAYRRRLAHIPEDVVFATKPELGRRMVQRALDAQVPARWVTADEVYGSDSRFRRVLEERSIGYVVAVSCQQRLFFGFKYGRADQHAASLPKRAWRKLSCGSGSKGERFYDWAYLPFPFLTDHGQQRGLLVRRSLEDPEDRAYYLTHAPEGTPLKTLVRVAGCRWAIEECFEQAKQETGLDECELRGWDGWHRHITLSMFAHALLAVVRSRAPRTAPKKRRSS
jgi:SRSO17 transposase